MFRSFILALLFTATARAAAECTDGQSQMSVEGVEGIFCVDGSPICIADISDGLCPDPQDGLPDGSYCGLVASGVYGCKAGINPNLVDNFDGSLPDEPTDEPTNEPTDEPTDAPSDEPTDAPTDGSMDGPSDEPTETPTETPVDATTDMPTVAPTESPTMTPKCPEGQSEMSVEGAEGIFCVAGWPICMAQIWNGTCPGPQQGLPDGAYCGLVASGVYGCKANSGSQPVSPTPVSETPFPSTTTPDPVGETPSPVSEAPAPANETPTPAFNGACAVGHTPMSIEGIVPILCVREPACVGTRSNGFCPEAQPGLEAGSYCDIVRTGVYGCKVYNGTAVSYPPLPACDGAHGDTPVSVVGAGTFCAPQPVCSGDIAGKCPTQQNGLNRDSVCAIIETGVYGCVLPVV